MKDNFEKYDELSRTISQLIKQEKYQETLQKFDEILETALQLSQADKWFVESASRKIRFLIKFNEWDELKKFEEKCNHIMGKFGDDPFHKWSIAKHLTNMAQIDEYAAYRSVINSLQKALLGFGLINEEMTRQKRLSELVSDQKNFYNELLGKIEKHGYKAKNKTELKKLTQMNNADLQQMDLHKILFEIVDFSVYLR